MDKLDLHALKIPACLNHVSVKSAQLLLGKTFVFAGLTSVKWVAGYKDKGYFSLWDWQ